MIAKTTLAFTLIFLISPTSQGFVFQPILENLNISDFVQEIFNELNSTDAEQLRQLFFNGLNSTINSTDAFVNRMADMLQYATMSSKCLVAFSTMISSYKEAWVLQMMDSYGIPSSAILEGNLAWPGSFGQCNSASQDSEPDESKQIRGQYCWTDFKINVTGIKAIEKVINVNSLDIKNGICIPNVCSSDDIQSAINAVIGYIGIKTNTSYLLPSAVTCIPEERTMWKDPGAIVSLIFCILMATIIFIGTAYDLTQRRNLQMQERAKSPAKSVSFSGSINSDKAPVIDNEEVQPGASANPEAPNEPHGESARPKSGPVNKFLLAFSFYTNGSKLLSLTAGKDTLTCLNGIRFFSMVWIILGHSYLVGDIETSNNLMKISKWIGSTNFVIVASAMFAVDTFFVLSGLLVTYLYLREHEKRGRTNWIKFYVHRYLRLTPLYAIVMLVFTMGFGKYYANGPFWPEAGVGGQWCSKHWWWNLLYINNFLKNKQMCMGHTWYLANDMQFYIISPLILIFLTKSVTIAAAICGGFILASAITSGVIVSVNHIYHPEAILQDFADMFDGIYDKPYCRVSAYVIGMMCGYLLYKTKCQHKISKTTQLVCWLLAIVLSASVVFGPYHMNFTLQTYSLYHALCRIAWSLAVGWLIFACCNGYGGIVNDILSWPLWQPLGRLTYSAYLIHMIVIQIFVFSLDISFPYSYTANVMLCLSTTVVAYFLAIFLSLSFEAPFLALEKIFM